MPEKDQYDCAPCEHYRYAFGVIDAISASQEKSPHLFDGPLLVDLAEQMVKLEIADSPTEVGLPISILSLTTKGAEWKERGLCCW